MPCVVHESFELVADPAVVGEHRAAAAREQLDERARVAAACAHRPCPTRSDGAARPPLGRDPEAAQQALDLGVGFVDRLPARLGVQPAVERDAVDPAVQGVHPPADARAALRARARPTRRRAGPARR